MNAELEDAFATIHNFLRQDIELAGMMMRQQVREPSEPLEDDEAADFALRCAFAIHRTRLELQELSDYFQKIQKRWETIQEQELCGSDRSDTSEVNGLRHIRVELTEGMINQKMLTLTQAKRRGIIRDNEKFRITMPDGEIIETELAQPGNRLRERGAFGRLYQKEKIDSFTCIDLHETQPGHWTLSVWNLPDCI
jgi:hypothetical protein